MIDVKVLIFAVSATLMLSGFNNIYAQTNTNNINKVMINFLNIHKEGSLGDSDIKGMTIVNEYPIINLLDGNKNTTIVLRDYLQDVPAIQIDFKEPFLVDEIKILGGYGKNKELFIANSRLKYLFIGLGDENRKGYKDGAWRIVNKIVKEKSAYTYLLNDNYEYLVIKSTNQLGSSVTDLYLDIKNTFKGTKYPNDLCISEIQFWYKGKRYEIANMKEIADGFDYETGIFRSTNSD